MGITQRIYDASPICLQNMLVSLKGYANIRQRYGKEYRRYRKFLEEFDRWPLEKKLEYQREETVKFVRFAYENSPFYRELYREEYDELLRREFAHKFGLRTRLVIEHVEEIPREASGKFRMIKNNVQE